MGDPVWMTQSGKDVLIRIKVVPGASQSEVVGVLGDALKVRIAAPPEAGRANAALLELLSSKLGVPAGTLRIESGSSSPRKLIRLTAPEIGARHHWHQLGTS